MSIHKRRIPRDCMDENANATGKLPTQPGKVICYTVEQNNKHLDAGVHTKQKVQTGVRYIKRTEEWKLMGATQRWRSASRLETYVFMQVCVWLCVIAPLYRCSALLAVGSRGERSLFQQMERDSPGLRKTQRAENSMARWLTRTRAHTHTHTSHVLEHQVAATWVLENPPGKWHTARYNLFVLRPTA